MDPQKTPEQQTADNDKSTPNQEAVGAPPISSDDSDSTSFESPANSAATPQDEPASELDADQSETPNDTVEPPAMAGQTFGPAVPSVPDEFGSRPADASVISDATPLALSMAPEGRKKKKGLLLGLIVAATLLLLSGGAAAAYYYVANKPENVLLRALGNLIDSDTRSVEFEGDINLEYQLFGMEMGASFTGEASETAMELSGSLTGMFDGGSFDLRSPNGKDMYLRVGGLEAVSAMLDELGDPSMSAYASMMMVLDGQWIEAKDAIEEDTGDSEADTAKVGELYQKHPFLVVKEVLPNEEVAGVNSHHFKLVADKGKLKDFATALKDAKIASFPITDDDLDEFVKSLDEVDLADYPFEVWISKADKTFRQLAFDGEYQGLNVDFTVTVKSFNQPVEVEVPEGAKSFEEIMSGLSESLGIDESLLLPDMSSGISL
jgi:hypothetical protein